jgi:[ribosomal protein S5]-alanine N-acetyltransferase
MADHPVLATERLTLREFAMRDAEDVARLAGEKEIAATTRFIPHPYTLDMAKEWLGALPGKHERGEILNFAITVTSTGELVGSIGFTLNPIDNHGEMGYWIGKPYWNQGYATEAGKELVRYAFEQMGLFRVYAHYMTKNTASGRVMQKLGMRREGTMRDHRLKWGKYEDLAIYGILKTDYVRQQKQAAAKKKGET